MSSWRTIEHQQRGDITRLLMVVQHVIYFACLCAAAWLILAGVDVLAGPDLCGNGRVDPGENCTTCPKDVMCLECEICVGPKCVDIGNCGDCGNGRVDRGENCDTCPEDVPCIGCLTCFNGECVANPLCGCGNGVPDPGETCATCPEDVICPPDTKCIDGKCINKCISKVSPMEVIFLFDTSGSMSDEAVELCAALDGIQESLEAFGLNVTIKVWGIAPGIQITCLTEYVSQYGPIQNESWAEAVTLMSPNYPWQPGARILVPISDEGPFNGDPCNTPEDTAAVEEAILIANKHNVIVNVIQGTVWGAEPECIEHFGRKLSFGTGGTWHFTEDVEDVDMESIVLDLINATLCGCAGDLNLDAQVDILDFLIWLAHWGLMDTDIDGDGDTDSLDLFLLFQHWGRC